MEHDMETKLLKLFKENKTDEIFKFIEKYPNFLYHVFSIAIKEDVSLFVYLEENFPYTPDPQDVYYIIKNMSLDYIKYIFRKYKLKNDNCLYTRAAEERRSSKVSRFMLDLPVLFTIRGLLNLAIIERDLEKIKELLPLRNPVISLSTSVSLAIDEGHLDIAEFFLEIDPSSYKDAFLAAHLKENYKFARKMFKKIEDPNTLEILALFIKTYNKPRFVGGQDIDAFTSNPKFSPNLTATASDVRNLITLLSVNVSLDSITINIDHSIIKHDKIGHYFKNHVEIGRLRKDLKKLKKLDNDLLDLIQDEEFLPSSEIKLFEKQFQVLDVMKGQIKNEIAKLEREKSTFLKNY